MEGVQYTLGYCALLQLALSLGWVYLRRVEAALRLLFAAAADALAALGDQPSAPPAQDEAKPKF